MILKARWARLLLSLTMLVVLGLSFRPTARSNAIFQEQREEDDDLDDALDGQQAMLVSRQSPRFRIDIAPPVASASLAALAPQYRSRLSAAQPFTLLRPSVPLLTRLRI